MKIGTGFSPEEVFVQIVVNKDELFALTSRGRVLAKAAYGDWVEVDMPEIDEQGYFITGVPKS